MEPKALLKNVYLFRDATPEDLAAVAAIAEVKSYIAGDFLYQAGSASEAFFVIESGTIDVTLKDRDIPVGSVGSDQALGEMAFFERGERLASALAREPTRLLRVPFDKLDRVLAERPGLALGFYQHACIFLSRQLRAVAPDVTRRFF